MSSIKIIDGTLARNNTHYKNLKGIKELLCFRL